MITWGTVRNDILELDYPRLCQPPQHEVSCSANMRCAVYPIVTAGGGARPVLVVPAAVTGGMIWSHAPANLPGEPPSNLFIAESEQSTGTVIERPAGTVFRQWCQKNGIVGAG